jgi:hypothetical protein
LAGEKEVLKGNLLQCHFVHHKFHMNRPGLEPGPPQWEAGGIYIGGGCNSSSGRARRIVSCRAIKDKRHCIRNKEHTKICERV